MSCSDSSFTAYLTSCRWMGCFWWNKLKYTYFVFLGWCWVKLAPRLCWLLQWWNYCCVIALDGLACAELKEFNEHKVELNLTLPMVKSNADSCTLQYLLFPAKVWSPERLSESQLITIFSHHVLPLGGSCMGILNSFAWDCMGSWMVLHMGL